ncbi:MULTISPECIES: AIPR family protein [unclassified Bradyrhizobium]|uniref:AIPR family protein n=1 Tax=unclassified Bradyrhizobium TaxID=2631580 RepID=UPI001BA951D1|nr:MULTISPECIES: AIPR family protein [unclassified Bradyrhizobium]MBR1206465.1 AIPR family protein [Bradyrhizobium sp. AUGA SZCCT0124]MBR1315557.1 AIPR family protein [Bradyrhizobium sp. AUGA SZCCT0051]MBR1338381.1 AIPR family protein [Bradyrhizobium sp. AUGA SZCCT0105]MBR1356036.1 AIPR family protein [Bradyrhizobium sp. AUGA SZCCT0045]
MSRPNLKVINGSSRSPSRLDWATVEQAITQSGSDCEARTLKFQRLVLKQLLGILATDADQYVTDGGDDCGIDCFVIDYNDNKIHLISTKTVEAYDKANKNFPGVEVSKLICFVRDLVTRADTLPIRCNPLLRAKVTEAWDAIDNGRVFHICVHVCSNQSNLIERDFRSLQDGLNEFKATAFEHPLSRFSDDVSKNWSPPTSKALRFIGKEQFEHHQRITDGSEVKSLIGSVRVSDLYEFLRNDQNNFVDDSLFHANVRGHLGIQNPVNREIAGTLRDSSKDFFFFLNNGITIVCDKYLYQSGGFPVTLHRPQIVNGRQTAETVFSVHRQGGSEIDDVTIFVRIIETSRPSLIEEISVATNSQSRIGARDLRANHSVARKLGAGLYRLGYYYVRKRGEVSTLPPEKTIDALKAGQLILAYLKGLPEKAKTDTTSMFAESFEDVFDTSLVTPELLVTAHQIFLDIEQEKHRAMITMRKSGLSATSIEHWVVEGSFHVLYCVGLFAKKRQLDLANYAACAPLVEEQA